MNKHEVAVLSGLEIMQAMVAGAIPRPSISITIPMEFKEVGKGFIRVIARADDRHINPLGGVHGGFAATVLDSVTGCAVHTMLEAGVGYGTVDLNVKMLKPIPRDTDLTAHGKVLHVSRSLGVAEGTIHNADGVLLAHATATCFIVRPTVST